VPTAVGPSIIMPSAPDSCVPANGVSVAAFVRTFTTLVVCTTSPTLNDVAVETAARFEPEPKRPVI
jgi:hypothetical protein